MKGKITIEDVYPLLPAQRGFLVDSLAGEEDNYRQQICVKINVPAPALVNNIQELVARNRILRTIFDWSDGEPVQVVIAGIDPIISTFSIPNDGTLPSLLRQEKNALRAISDAPPIRFAIIRDGQKLLLVITYHHILLDGPSVNILLEQVLKASYLPEVPADVYHEWLAQNTGVNEFAIWRDLLSGIDKQSGAVRGATNRNSVKRYRAKFDTSFHGKLLDKAKELHTTPAVCMQTLWSEWAMMYFDKESLLYGLVTSTRVIGLSDAAIGPYISTVPWFVHRTDDNLDSAIRLANDQVLSINKAKHIPLGDITKQISPFAMSFDVILAIATHPVRDTKSYKVVEIYENTGYKLTVDIEISNDITVSFSTSLDNMADALKSFISYSEQQINRSAKVSIRQHYVSTSTLEEDQTINTENRGELIAALASILDIPKEDVHPTSSFLGMGGDSIMALRLKSVLKNKGLDASIGDILQAPSLQELASKIKIHTPKLPSTESSATESIKMAKDILGSIVEDVDKIPMAAQAIVDAYRLGFGQDYHEQTAFRLRGSFDALKFADALDKLAKEYPSLRLVYPSELPDSQVLTTISRASLKVEKPTRQSFLQFVRRISQEYWEAPFDITKGPLLRAVMASNINEEECYFFMSFSALVTDGWSFSTMLERLFSIYGDLLVGSYIPLAADPYFEYSKSSLNSPVDQKHAPVAFNNYSSEIMGKNFIIDRVLTAKIFNKSKESHHTVSDILLRSLRKSLKHKGFTEIKVYENGRDDPHLFTSVGPYSYLSTKKVAKNCSRQAYYVFENYPRDSENRLKNGRVQYFKENGNWRRDLLPPLTDVGFLFDVDKDVINVRVLVRADQGERNIIGYWKALLTVIEEG